MNIRLDSSMCAEKTAMANITLKFSPNVRAKNREDSQRANEVAKDEET